MLSTDLVHNMFVVSVQVRHQDARFELSNAASMSVQNSKKSFRVRPASVLEALALELHAMMTRINSLRSRHVTLPLLSPTSDVRVT